MWTLSTSEVAIYVERTHGTVFIASLSDGIGVVTGRTFRNAISSVEVVRTVTAHGAVAEARAYEAVGAIKPSATFNDDQYLGQTQHNGAGIDDTEGYCIVYGNFT